MLPPLTKQIAEKCYVTGPIDSLAKLKDLLKKSPVRPRIYIWGHCGGPDVTRPGVKLSKTERFDLKSIQKDPELVNLVKGALAPNGELFILACGYREQPGYGGHLPGPGGTATKESMKQWDDDLQALANALGRKVCASPGPFILTPVYPQSKTGTTWQLNKNGIYEYANEGTGIGKFFCAVPQKK